MSANDPKRTSLTSPLMSANDPKADMTGLPIAYPLVSFHRALDGVFGLQPHRARSWCLRSREGRLNGGQGTGLAVRPSPPTYFASSFKQDVQEGFGIGNATGADRLGQLAAKRAF
jgi:hypothetical protein